MSERPICVTQPYLPPLDDFISCPETTREHHVLTHKGPFYQQLEKAFCDHVGVERPALFANGNLAKGTTLRALGIACQDAKTRQRINLPSAADPVGRVRCLPVLPDLSSDAARIALLIHAA
jgi:dTDP-4-amino-4,6-dideoxygalactose transaminase